MWDTLCAGFSAAGQDFVTHSAIELDKIKEASKEDYKQMSMVTKEDYNKIYHWFYRRKEAKPAPTLRLATAP